MLALQSTGAILGIFCDFVCTVTRGLDAAPPDVAIRSMQQINTAVRNATFAIGIFGTPVFLALTAIASLLAGARRAAGIFGVSTMTYLGGALILTVTRNVPMNTQLAQTLYDSPQAAAQVWAANSPCWQAFNIVRTVVSGGVLLLAALGFAALNTPAQTRSRGKNTGP